MERMDVFELIPAATDAWRGGRRTPEGFRECRRFVTQSDCVETSNELASAVAESCAMTATSLRALKSCIAELAENVVFHAEAADGGYAAAQTWRRRERLEVGIVDLGRGIRRSLIENPRYANLDNDVDAINTAMQLGVTATPERNTGQGLFSTARLLEFNGGHVLVRSGCGCVYDGSRQENGEASFFPGTLVALTINTSRPLDDGAVARLIGDLKGGDEDLDDLFD
jgi:anti-sigma regulatory factor (Ser/Thr protein kinase)